MVAVDGTGWYAIGTASRGLTLDCRPVSSLEEELMLLLYPCNFVHNQFQIFSVIQFQINILPEQSHHYFNAIFTKNTYNYVQCSFLSSTIIIIIFKPSVAIPEEGKIKQGV